MCLLLAGCAHPRGQQGNLRREPPPVRTTADSRPDAPEPVPPAPAATAQRVDFTGDVRPILETHCRPCHFEGGRMYERLPFDRAKTIQDLGPRLFTRIKAENEQAVIRRFLSQGQ